MTMAFLCHTSTPETFAVSANELRELLATGVLARLGAVVACGASDNNMGRGVIPIARCVGPGVITFAGGFEDLSRRIVVGQLL